MLIIPRAEAPQLVNHYSAQLMSNDRLQTAATLAAKQHRILHDPTLTAYQKDVRLRPINRRLRQSKKRLRQVNTGLPNLDDEDDDNDMSTPAGEKLFRRLVKAIKSPGPAAGQARGGTTRRQRLSFPSTPKRPPLSTRPEEILKSGKKPTPPPKPPAVIMTGKLDKALEKARKAAGLSPVASGVTTRSKKRKEAYKKEPEGAYGPQPSWRLPDIDEWEDY